MNEATAFGNIKTIFFDIADTLYINEEMEAAYPQKLVDLLSASRSITSNEAKALLKETTEKLKATTKHVTKVRTMAELGYTRAQVHEAFCKVDPADFLSPDKALRPVMAQLAKRYKLGIISNFKHSHALEIFSALDLSPDWFPLLVTEDIVKEIKPAHEPFLKAIELSGYAANECLYVGDSPTKDMQPAKEVGMTTILIGSAIPDEYAAYIDAAIPDVKKIVALLEIA